jgi:hypothetical protein
MNHPNNRCERRYCRERIIAYRRFVYEHIWNRKSIQSDFLRNITNPLITMEYIFECALNDPKLDNVEEWIIEWSKYSKWNFTCDPKHCRMCSWQKAVKKAENKRSRIASKKACGDWEMDCTHLEPCE